MPEINLLPDELREKEGRELEIIRKKPREMKIEMAVPKKEKEAKPPRPSLFSRWFGKKPKPAMPPKPVMPPRPEPPRLMPMPPAPKKEPVKVTVVPPSIFRPQLPKPVKPPRPSFFRRWFGKKPKPALPPKPVMPPRPEPPKFVPPPPMPSLKTEPIKVMPAPARREPEMPPRPAAPLPKPAVFAAPPKPAAAPKKPFFAGLIAWVSRFGKKKPLGEKAAEKKPRREKRLSLDVNLMPLDLAKRPELELTKKLFISGTIVFISLLLVVIGYLGITWYQLRLTRQISDQRQQLASLDRDIGKDKEQAKAASALQDKLVTVRDLLNRHIYWTKFFSLLEKNTLPEVSYTNFAMAGQEKLVISALGRDYRSVAKQLVAFQQAKDFVAKVKIDSASASFDDAGKLAGVGFNIELEFAPDIFSKPIE